MSDEDVVKCPECGGETDHETVHNGVALLHGPNHCIECEWTEWSDAGKVVDGYRHDRAGGKTPVDPAAVLKDLLG